MLFRNVKLNILLTNFLLEGFGLDLNRKNVELSPGYCMRFSGMGHYRWTYAKTGSGNPYGCLAQDHETLWWGRSPGIIYLF